MMRGALLSLSVMLVAAAAAPAGAVVPVDLGVVKAGVLQPGESVFLGDSGAVGNTVYYRTDVQPEGAKAQFLRISCFFWCAPYTYDAATLGQEVLHPFEGGEVLYLVAPVGVTVTYAAVIAPGQHPDLCPAIPPTDFCSQG